MGGCCCACGDEGKSVGLPCTCVAAAAAAAADGDDDDDDDDGAAIQEPDHFPSPPLRKPLPSHLECCSPLQLPHLPPPHG